MGVKTFHFPLINNRQKGSVVLGVNGEVENLKGNRSTKRRHFSNDERGNVEDLKMRA